MNVWKAELLAILNSLLGSPSTKTEFIILSAVVVITSIVGLRIASGVFGLKMNEWWRVIFVAIATFAVAFASVAAIRIYLLGAISSASLQLGLQIGAAVLVVLIIGIPLQILLQKGNYLEALSSFAATLIITALITAGAHTAYQAIVVGGAQMQRAAEKNKETAEEAAGSTR